MKSTSEMLNDIDNGVLVLDGSEAYIELDGKKFDIQRLASVGKDSLQIQYEVNPVWMPLARSEKIVVKTANGAVSIYATRLQKTTYKSSGKSVSCVDLFDVSVAEHKG